MSNRHLIFATVLAFSLISSPIFAEDSGSAATAPATPTNDQIAALQKLKETNPEAFREQMQQRKEDFRKKMEQMREQNPDQFKAIVQKRIEERRQKMQELRKNDPEKFKEYMQQEKQRRQERLEKMKQRNPEKFAEFMKRREERMAQRKERFGQKFGNQQEIGNAQNDGESVDQGANPVTGAVDPAQQNTFAGQGENTSDRGMRVRDAANASGARPALGAWRARKLGANWKNR